MNQIAINIKNINKKYFIEKPKTLKKWVNTLFSPFDKLTVFDNFSLHIKKGEFLQIKGPNGCGKTTLLKLIAGITYPDSGSIETFGKVVPLIELGVGFSHELTGWENIIINSAILGIDRNQTKKVIPAIISFSGLKQFINVPVKRYSSGMLSRLAFSIAAYSQPDILLLDEIFAVGDKEFRSKSINKLTEFKKEGVTILLCTHIDYELKIVDRVINIKN